MLNSLSKASLILLLLSLSACAILTDQVTEQLDLPTEQASPSPSTEPYHPLPDLTISNMYVEMEGRQHNECIEEYTPYGIRVIVQNIGDEDAGPFFVHVNAISTVITMGLPAGESIELHFHGTDPSGQYSATVDMDGEIQEISEENNTQSYIAPTPTPPILCAAVTQGIRTPSHHSTLPTHTLSPTTPLSEMGPWLVGLSSPSQPEEAQNEEAYIAINLDGSGRTELNLPWGWNTRLGTVPSERGCFVFRTGEGSEDYQLVKLALTIFCLPSPEPIRSIQLFSDNLIGMMEQMGEEEFEAQSSEFGDLYRSIKRSWDWNGRHQPLWSPDGRFLAFSAARDGLSSDVYVYDAQEDEIRRLTDEPEQVMLLDWSPDGRWIIYSQAIYFIPNTFSSSGYSAMSVWAVSIDGEGPKELYKNPESPWYEEQILGWVSSTTFIAGRTQEDYQGIHPHNLRKVNITNGSVSTIYKGNYKAIATDPIGGTLFFVPGSRRDFPLIEDSLVDGLYRVPPGATAPELIPLNTSPPTVDGICWQPQTGNFYLSLLEFSEGETYSGVVAIKPSGEVTQSYQHETRCPNLSPDGQLLQFLEDDPYVYWLRIYNSSGKLQREILLHEYTHTAWAPDSQGLFFLESVSSGPLQLMNLPSLEEEPLKVEVFPGFHSWTSRPIEFFLIQGSDEH